VDWDYVENSGNILANKQNLLGDSEIWLQLLPYLDFGKLDMEPLELQARYPPIWTLYKTMDAHVGHDSLWSFNDTCKLFLLNNLIGIPFKYITERYITKTLKQSSHVICGKIMENMAEERHDAGVYLDSMNYVLSSCKLNTTALDLHIQHYRSTIAEQRASWTMKHIRVQCRPSMRGVLAIKRIADGTRTQMSDRDESALGIITFDAFCDIVRFPNCMSLLLRSRCYLLACQNHFDFTPFTSLIVSAEIATVINSNRVLCPDEASLCKCINTLTLSIHPFEELKLFRKNCFSSYAANQSNRLTMTDVLQMYVCAYQSPSMWKNLWKSVDPLMSTQISKDVESFVKQNKFAATSFVQILQTSTSRE
jgi:hypothetical protein